MNKTKQKCRPEPALSLEHQAALCVGRLPVSLAFYHHFVVHFSLLLPSRAFGIADIDTGLLSDL
jgi:hypothetical protein